MKSSFFRREIQAFGFLLCCDARELTLGLPDSEWAFALYLSKLPDVHASSFSQSILRKAMLDTIAHLNEMARDAGITEVSTVLFSYDHYSHHCTLGSQVY